MKIKEVYDEYVVFDNGDVIDVCHESTCYDKGWGDFSVLRGYNINPRTGKSIKYSDIDFPEDIENHIELIERSGFNLIAKDGSKYFIPCYSENNGYYDDNLTMEIYHKNNDETLEKDIRECQENV